MQEDINAKQIEILHFIKRVIQYKGYPPSIREIGKSLNIKSTSTVHQHILVLENKGYIRRDPEKNRALEIIDRESEAENIKRETFDIPVLGKVQAGIPTLAIENIEDYFPVPIEYAKYGNVFMLKVQGESMIEAAILPGDQVIVRQQTTAENGEIIVALIDESATIKTFYKRDDYIELKPENKTMPSIMVKHCHILGKVVGLYRFF